MIYILVDCKKTQINMLIVGTTSHDVRYQERVALRGAVRRNAPRLGLLPLGNAVDRRLILREY